MGLMTGKRLLVTGVITDQSIAYSVARLALAEGATVLLTGYGRVSLVERMAKRLGIETPVLELDATDPEHLASLAGRVGPHVDGLDGVLHAIAFGPQSTLGGGFMTATWTDVSTALHASTYSYQALAVACEPLLGPGSAIVGLTFDASQAWPAYDWMGVAKAGLESANRYLARYLGPKGIRVNLVSAGPLKTLAAKAIPGFEDLESMWSDRAPLGWDETDHTPTARAVVALLSDYFPATTGEIVHVDGGFHAMGA